MLLLCLHSPLLDILGDKGDGDSCGSLMVVKWRRQSSLHLHPLSPSLKCRHLLTTLSPWLVNGYTWAICWKIGKLYLCQTSSNHCQFFSHIVKFDFVIRKYFLWNCCDWDYQTCLGVLEKSDGNWDFEAPTSFGISDLTFKRFHCLCVRLRFRY